MALLPVAFATALAAVTPPAVDAGVLRCVFVALRAMSLSRLFRRKSLTSKDVLTMGHWFQMGRSHAVTDAAEVVEVESRRNRTIDQFIGDAMSVEAWGSELPISRVIEGTRPKPARFGLIDVTPKSLSHRHSKLRSVVDFRGAISALPRVVLHTKAEARDAVRAPIYGAMCHVHTR